MKELSHTKGRTATVATVSTDRGYFSLTGEVRTPYKGRNPEEGSKNYPPADGYDDNGKPYEVTQCGAIGDALVKIFPRLAPINAMHLASTVTGEPMHGYANGWHWLRGYLTAYGVPDGQYGPTAKPYGSAKTYTPEQCRDIFASHVRVTQETVEELVRRIRAGLIGTEMQWPDEAESIYREWYAGQQARMKAEAVAALELIEAL